MAYDFRRVFTGAGVPSPAGYRMNFQWLGISSTLPVNGNYSPLVFTSIVNGSIQFSEQSNVVTLQTTAWNGFVDGYAENAVISGTVRGFAQGTYLAPAPVSPVLPNTGRVWWMKILIGTIYYEGKTLISGLDIASDLEEVVTVVFNFTFIGLPRTTQVQYLTGGNPPL